MVNSLNSLGQKLSTFNDRKQKTMQIISSLKDIKKSLDSVSPVRSCPNSKDRAG